MKKTLPFMVLIFSFIYITGCSNSNNPVGTKQGTGTMQVNMIDSPASFDQVNIVIDSVTAHISTSDSTSGWVTLNNKPATYDLLKLVNGANAVIGKSEVPVGTYSQLRLYIGDGSNVVTGGQTFALKTPSGSQSGVKLDIHSTIEADVNYILTLDFDANQSVVVTGNPVSPKFILKPVIRTVVTGTTGIIRGKVSPDSVSASVWAFDTSDTLSTYTDSTGSFKFAYLPPSTYSVKIIPFTAPYRDTTVTNVSVTASNTTDLGAVVLTHK